MSEHAVISIVDDDESIRESLLGLLESLRMAARAYASAEEFLASNAAASTACLLLDMTLGEMSGIDLQARLLADGQAPPIVFITATGDERTRQLVLARGALAYLRKPFPEHELLQAIELATHRRP
jgi:FixJ family two-component response regulator